MNRHLQIILTQILVINGCTSVDDFDTLESEVLVPSCGFSSCHGSGTGGLTIASGESYDELVGNMSDSEPEFSLVTPFDPSASYLMMKLEGSNIVGDAMPPSGALLEDEIIDRVRFWIEAGALP